MEDCDSRGQCRTDTSPGVDEGRLHERYPSSSPEDRRQEEEERSQEACSRYPDYCRTLKIRDSSGAIKELVFPKALDLDRPKRARTTFSVEQLYQLEREFQRNQYLVGRERTDLAHSLHLSETQVKVWFQNRRTKYKRDKSREADEIKQNAEGLAACNILRILQHKPPAGGGRGQGPPTLRPGLPPAPAPTVVRQPAPLLPNTLGPMAMPFPFPPPPQMTHAQSFFTS